MIFTHAVLDPRRNASRGHHRLQNKSTVRSVRRTTETIWSVSQLQTLHSLTINLNNVHQKQEGP